MNSSEVRKQNLKTWIDSEFGGKIADFCRAYALSPAFASYLSQILNGGKSFGERAARKLEEQTARPSEWLDRPVNAAEGSESQIFRYDPKRCAKLTSEDRELIENFISMILARHEASRLAKVKKQHELAMSEGTDLVKAMAESARARTAGMDTTRKMNLNDRVKQSKQRRSTK